MIKNILTYTKERFPVIPALLFSFLFGFAGIAYANEDSNNFGKILIVSLMMFLFLLRIRLWDELKDFQYDSKHHESRPVQKGILSLSIIKRVALVILFVEISMQLFLPFQTLPLFLLAVAYSFLMFKNFYIKDLENKSFVLFLFSHQIIFIIYILYTLSVGSSYFFIPKSSQDIWIILALFLPTLIYEVGRKVKHRISPKGYATNDTYIYRWGEKRSYAFLLFLYCLQALSISLVIHRLDFLVILQMLAIVIIAILYFIKRKMIIDTSDKWSIALGMYGLIILNFYLL